jgi:ABC-2 type transport system ATP-binding protein
MRVLEYLAFRAQVKQVPSSKRVSYIDDAMTRANVLDVANATIGTLSKGYRQRVGLADALVAKPPVLILDEPTAGLDPNQVRDVRKVLASLAGECTVLLSTHILSEVEASCEQVVVIDQGKLVASGTLDDIRAKDLVTAIELCVSLPSHANSVDVLKGLKAFAFVNKARVLEEKNGIVRAHLTLLNRERVSGQQDGRPEDFGRNSEAIAKHLIQQNIGVRELRPVRTSLEEVFSRLTGDGAERERERERTETEETN